jgi:hypothetical protein
MARALGVDPRRCKIQPTLLRFEKIGVIRRCQRATSAAALRFSALPSQDEARAAHELQFPRAAHSACGAQLQAEEHSADEVQAARELPLPDVQQALHELQLAY